MKEASMMREDEKKFPEIEIIERSDDIRDVTDGPIVGALVAVFRQLEQMGVRRHGREG
jgi:hypothetical protein